MNTVRRFVAPVLNALLLIVAVAAAAALFFRPLTKSVEAQSGGAFGQRISATMSAVQTFVSINNLGQEASSVEYTASASNTCRILLENSADQVHWTVLGQAWDLQTTNFIFGNGFYNYLRLALNANSSSSCNGETITGNYYGLTSPLYLSGNSGVSFFNQIGAPKQFSTPNPAFYEVSSYQCMNYGAATAYIQFFDGLTAPSLGSGEIYEIGIGAGQSVHAQSSPLLYGEAALWIGSATSSGGTTAAGSVECNVQFNYSGPFHPLMPQAP